MTASPRSMPHAFAAITVLAAGFAFGEPAAAPPSSFGLRVSAYANADCARLLGVLTYTRLSMRFEDVAVRDAFAAIASTLNINIVGRWNDDRRNDSIDPDMRVTLITDDRSARNVIEELLEQCEEYDDCTWQIRGGFIEIGSKRRLAVPAAREQRTYDLTDLLMEPLYSPSAIAGDEGFVRVDTAYVDAVLGEKSRQALRAGTFVRRKTKSDIILELAEGIVETVEPGRWDLGGDRPAGNDDNARSPGATSQPQSTQKPGARKSRHWASMRVFREAFIITAPDFVHRQIGGYPRPIKPVDAETVRLVPSPGAVAEPGADAGADSANSSGTP